jgi:hypothetical protein
MPNVSTPPVERLIKLLDWPELADVLGRWPSKEPVPCRKGPKLMWHDNRTQPTVRVMLESTLGPLHRSWRVKRTCERPECIHPWHYSLENMQRIDGTPREPLPQRCFQFTEPAYPEEDDVDTAVAMILHVEGHNDDPQALAERFDLPIDAILQALQQIKEEGL